MIGRLMLVLLQSMFRFIHPSMGFVVSLPAPYPALYFASQWLCMFCKNHIKYVLFVSPKKKSRNEYQQFNNQNV